MRFVDRSEEWCKNISKSKEGKNNPMFGKKGASNPNSIVVFRYSLEDTFIDEWDNASQAAESLGLNYKAINACLKGRSNSSGGFKWKIKKEENVQI